MDTYTINVIKADGTEGGFSWEKATTVEMEKAQLELLIELLQGAFSFHTLKFYPTKEKLEAASENAAQHNFRLITGI
jgi:hypothetical protein